MHWEVKDRHLAEKQVHNALRKFRIMNEKGGKEWFKLTVEEGILRVSKLIEIFVRNMVILMTTSLKN